MKLRLGQDVHATDGIFGQLGDIIVDPVAKTITHIVAEPNHNHYQARLVPIWLVTEADGELTVQLDIDHVRQLERVSYSDYIPLGEPIDVGDSWDIGVERVFSYPYHDFEFDMGWHDDRVGVSYDRIPKGECEIRRESEVVSSDGKVIGRVHGLLADENHIKAVIVRSGIAGFRHDVLIPLDSIDAVRVDQIDLTITTDEFGLLPRTDVLRKSDDALRAHAIDLRRRAESVGDKVADTGRSLVTSARDRMKN